MEFVNLETEGDMLHYRIIETPTYGERKGIG